MDDNPHVPIVLPNDPGETIRAEWLAAAVRVVAERVAADDDLDEELVVQSLVVREHVALLHKYVVVCGKFQRYGLRLRHRANRPLVGYRFPVRLHCDSMKDLEYGVRQSFACFVDEVRHSVLNTSVEHLESASEPMLVGGECIAVAAANTLLHHTLQAHEGHRAEAAARARAARAFEDHANHRVAQERARLAARNAHCRALRDACSDFGMRPLRGKRRDRPEAVARAARQWANRALRDGCADAVSALAQQRRGAAVFGNLGVGRLVTTFAALADGRLVEDPEAVALYDCMQRAHAQLNAAMTWELRRNEWLLAAPDDHPCWSGLTVAFDHCGHAFDERLLQAPSHMAVFPRGRLRIVVDPDLERAAYTCGLGVVRLARVLAKLLRDGHMPLDRIGCNFAYSINQRDYARYEAYCARIEANELVPFGRRVGVPYVAGAVQAAELATRPLLRAAHGDRAPASA